MFDNVKFEPNLDESNENDSAYFGSYSNYSIHQEMLQVE